MRGINIAFKYLQILILKFYYSFYIDILLLLFLIISQSDYKVCHCSGFKRILYRHLLMTIFGLIKLKLFHTQNITIPNSINRVTIPQKYVFHLLCDLPAV